MGNFWILTAPLIICVSPLRAKVLLWSRQFSNRSIYSHLLLRSEICGSVAMPLPPTVRRAWPRSATTFVLWVILHHQPDQPWKHLCMSMRCLQEGLTKGQWPTQNMASTIKAGVPDLNKKMGVSKLRTSIHFSLLPHCRYHVTSCPILLPHLLVAKGSINLSFHRLLCPGILSQCWEEWLIPAL